MERSQFSSFWTSLLFSSKRYFLIFSHTRIEITVLTEPTLMGLGEKIESHLYAVSLSRPFTIHSSGPFGGPFFIWGRGGGGEGGSSEPKEPPWLQPWVL